MTSREPPDLGLPTDAVRDASGGRPLDDLVRDLGYALRNARRNPGFTLVAVPTPTKKSRTLGNVAEGSIAWGSTKSLVNCPCSWKFF